MEGRQVGGQLKARSKRDELKRHYNLGEYWIEVSIEDLSGFDENLADYLLKQPSEHLPLVRWGLGFCVCQTPGRSR
uniref:MCM N-terminal domain-containing protein n=1 Tax=Callorhinchus milii TaxID=7868 RepID=A0A4W3GP79_CALMI